MAAEWNAIVMTGLAFGISIQFDFITVDYHRFEVVSAAA
jgi:hypothetical protein